MARQNYAFEKRQRELAKKNKKEEKRQRKAGGEEGVESEDGSVEQAPEALVDTENAPAENAETEKVEAEKPAE
jgi:hypothetical protein